MGSSSANTFLTDHHGAFLNCSFLKNRKIIPIDYKTLKESDVIFLALPHGVSVDIVKKMKEEFGSRFEDVLILDLGADFRLRNKSDWEKYYPETNYSGENWCYGLPQIKNQKDLIQKSSKIAVPGCNASAVTLGLLPLFDPKNKKDQIVDLSQSVNAVLSVGYSGAGKTLKTHLLASESFNNMKPYAVRGFHRHIPEILQNLKCADLKLNFTPILIPSSRGILAVITLKLNSQQLKSDQDICNLYERYYQNSPFITILNSCNTPSTGNVVGSNWTQISAAFDRNSRDLTIIVAIDNLIKGTAGSAIESMNIALGLEQDLGLKMISQMR